MIGSLGLRFHSGLDHGQFGHFWYQSPHRLLDLPSIIPPPVTSCNLHAGSCAFQNRLVILSPIITRSSLSSLNQQQLSKRLLGREEEAHAFFVKYHGNGNPDDELVLFEWQEVQETIALCHTRPTPSSLLPCRDTLEDADRRRSCAEILLMPGNKHRLSLAGLMTFMPQMNGSSIILYYYSFVLEQSGISGVGTITGIGAGLNIGASSVKLQEC
ncbi:hypothetical protein IAR50_000641 [Cryptococcus sp. DSM 104548]